jgi:DNA polymerase III gamma/tau subunit
MSLQIFKNNVPNEDLFNLLNNICSKNEKYYVFNIESYKRGIYKELIQEFIQFCQPYYHISKRKYLDRNLTYNSFTTVLRQICKFNKIVYTNKIKYDKSTYSILYYIYY